MSCVKPSVVTSIPATSYTDLVLFYCKLLVPDEAVINSVLIKQMFILDMRHENSVQIMTSESSYWTEMTVE
jgi:hypothetical protein